MMVKLSVLCTSSPNIRVPLARVPERLFGELEDVIELLNKSNTIENVSIPFRTPQKSLNLNKIEINFHSLPKMKAINTALGETLVLESLKVLDDSLKFTETPEKDVRLTANKNVSKHLEELVENMLMKSLEFQPYSLLSHPVAMLNFVSVEDLSKPLKLNLSETMRFKLGLFDKKMAIIFVIVDETSEEQFLEFKKNCEKSGFSCVKFELFGFVENTLIVKILSHLENLIFQKYYEISNNMKSKNYFKMSYNKLIGSNINNEIIHHCISGYIGDEKISSRDIFYSSQTIEFKTLRLADLYFSLSEYKTAMMYYKQLKQQYNQHVSTTLFSLMAKTDEKVKEMTIKDEIQLYKASAIFQICLCLFELKTKGFVKEIIGNLSKIQIDCFQPLISKFQQFSPTPIFIRFQTYFVYVLSSKLLFHLSQNREHYTLTHLKEFYSGLSQIVNKASFYETKLFSGILLQKRSQLILLSRLENRAITLEHLPNELTQDYLQSGRSRKFGFLLLMTSSLFRQLSLYSVALYFLLLGEQIYSFSEFNINFVTLLAHITSTKRSLLKLNEIHSLSLTSIFSAEAKLSDSRYKGEIEALFDTSAVLLALDQSVYGIIRQDNASLLPDFEKEEAKKLDVYLNEPCWFKCQLKNLVNVSYVVSNIRLIYSFKGKAESAYSSQEAVEIEIKVKEKLDCFDKKSLFFKLETKTDCTLVLKGLQLKLEKFEKIKEQTLSFQTPLEVKVQEQQQWLGVDIVNLKESVIENEKVEAEMEVFNNGTIDLEKKLKFRCSLDNLVCTSEGVVKQNGNEYEIEEEVEVGLPLSIPLQLWFNNVFVTSNRVEIVFRFQYGKGREFEVRKVIFKENKMKLYFRRVLDFRVSVNKMYTQRIKEALEIYVADEEKRGVIEEIVADGFEEITVGLAKGIKLFKPIREKKAPTCIEWKIRTGNDVREGKTILV